MTHRAVALLLLACVAAVTTTTVSAATARTWSLSDADSFAGGTLDGTAVDGEGRVRLAFSTATLWGPAEGIVWDIAPTRDGAAFVALSSPGRILRVSAEGDAELWFRADAESLVAALAPDGEGGVYFGLSPEGQVLRGSAPKKIGQVVETGALFVWALAPRPGGGLWIATGMPGSLMLHEEGKEPRTLFDAQDDPVRCLAPLSDGGVVFGTGARGRVIRVDREERAFVLLDADESEIVALATTPEGTVYALAARSMQQLRGARPRAATVGATETVRVTVTPPASAMDAPESGQPPAAPAAPTRFSTPPGAVLYRIDPDGGRERIWESMTDVPFGLARREDGTLLVATGDKGKIYLFDERGRSSLLLQVPSDQASALMPVADGSVLVGGTGDARVERLGPSPQRVGTYMGPPVDARAVADWGRLRWDAVLPRGAGIEVRVRAGNTADPDATWSDWVVLDHPGTEGRPTRLPATRWFQARFDLKPSKKGESPLVRHVELFYQPRNRPPTVQDLVVQRAGVVWKRGPRPSTRQIGPQVADDPVAREATESLQTTRTPGVVRKAYELGARTVTWNAKDPDGDSLSYRLEIRREGSELWLPLGAEIRDEFYSWDARGTPDGTYRVRLTVDDSRANPGGKERSDRRLSPIFRVDNTRPAIAEHEIRRDDGRYEVHFTATDPGGNVAAVEVALDDGDWQPLDPLDGVADSAEEQYRFVVAEEDARPPADRALRVRVTDGAGNLGGDTWPLD